MCRHPSQLRRPGFTLLELVLVLAILAILSGLLMPSLWAFAVGRGTSNGATLIVGLSNYARTQAAAEGTPYRLNFDAVAGTVWLTYQSEGAYLSPTNDYGQRFRLADGVRMAVDVTPGPLALPAPSPAVQTTTGVQPAPPYGQPLVPPTNALVQVPHAGGGTYMEFQPSGRTDPVHVRLTDKVGGTVDLGCASATETLHVLKPGEL